MSIALIIALTFGLLLLIKRNGNDKADRFLALLMFIVALWNASIIILDLNIYRYIEGIFWYPLTYTLALGPCFYFYIRFVVDTDNNEKIKIWPHFIPVILEVLIFLYEVFVGVPQGKAYFQTSIFQVLDPIVSILAIVSFMIYGYLARKKIQKYHMWVKNNYSHYHRYNLNWLMRLSSIFLFLLTLWLGYFIIDYFLFDYLLSFREYYPFHLALALTSIWLSAEAFLKPDVVYSDKDLNIKTENKSIVVKDKDLQEKAHWLKKQIEKNLLFLDPEISLKTLAETINIHPNLVSKIINDGLGQTFSDCINEYRVNAVIKKLGNNEGKNATFLAIAFDCGFNSKTTFNRVFKKQIGLTPLQFRNNMQKA